MVIKRTDTRHYLVSNREGIEVALDALSEGEYFSILGPPFCGKTLLLNDIRRSLGDIGSPFSVLIDLREVEFSSDDEFLPSFYRMLSAEISRQHSFDFPRIDGEAVDERAVQRFIVDSMQQIGRDMVLLLDHPERIRLDPLKSLLQVLRSIFTERMPEDRFQLSVVIAASLNLAGLTLGENSPFNIAKVYMVRDLSDSESAVLVRRIIDDDGLEGTEPALSMLISECGGDRSLIPALCRRCAHIAVTRSEKRIRIRMIRLAVEWFVTSQAPNHQPLRATIRAIEESPIALLNVVSILDRGEVRWRDLRAASKSDIDELQLTGAVKVSEMAGARSFVVRNPVYESCLRQHFHPERVVQVLGMAGRWQDAVTYLERLVADCEELRPLLLSSVISSLYTAQSSVVASRELARSVSAAFSARSVSVYLLSANRSGLELVSCQGTEEASPSVSLEDEDQPEIVTFLRHDYKVRDHNGAQQIMITLRSDGSALGLVIVGGFSADPQSDAFIELLSFLKQVGQALDTVIKLERKVAQLNTLYETGKQVASSLDLQEALDKTVVSAIEAVPAAQKGSLFLWYHKKKKLAIAAQQGFDEKLVKKLQLRAGEGYAGWVYMNRKPLLLADIDDHESTVPIEHPQRSAVCVPLQSWGRVIGVLCVDNVTTYGAFNQEDLALLSAFGDKAATAIQNAQLYTELNMLSLRINRGDLKPKEIFEEVVQSILRISEAQAANMLLLRDTDVPSLSVRQLPLVSASAGFDEAFDRDIGPRSDGVTFKALTSRKPIAVNQPAQKPGIHPLCERYGIKASLCLPMKIHDTVVGVLFVHYGHRHSFSKNEIDMLSIFTNQAALAIENARQSEELAMTKAVAWMGMVVSSLSHRIKQKSFAIGNVLFVLRKLLKGNDEAQEHLEKIAEYTRLIRQLPAREAHFSEQASQVIDLNEFLREDIGRWACSPETRFQSDLSGLNADPAKVCVDKEWLAVVVEMLITNAETAMTEVKSPKIYVCSELRANRVVASFSDNGKGMPDRIRERIFKVPISISDGSKGSGVGLIIARTIMRRFGGNLELVKTASDGTTFEMWLPLFTIQDD
jgi:GAF domain-containing protein